uniref:Uncharacterized protein n=1 Tax=Strigamia maritima TaxID=126957 RepID=T1JPJ2_STRMM
MQFCFLPEMPYQVVCKHEPSKQLVKILNSPEECTRIKRALALNGKKRFNRGTRISKLSTCSKSFKF